MIFSRRSAELIVAALAVTILLLLAVDVRAETARRVVVEIQKFQFVPPTLTVRSGDIVVWKNWDIVPHTVTAEGQGWDSGTIEAQGEWEVVVTEDRLGNYFCRFHPSMTGTLETEIELTAL